jgi:hypothetical protein
MQHFLGYALTSLDYCHVAATWTLTLSSQPQPTVMGILMPF